MGCGEWEVGERSEGGGLLEAGNQGRAFRIINLVLVLYSHFETTNFPKYFVKETKLNRILYSSFRYIN
jgi:hypothetical protein